MDTQTMSTVDGIPTGTPTVSFNLRTYVASYKNNLQMSDHTYATVGMSSSQINDTTVNSVRHRPLMSSFRQQ